MNISITWPNIWLTIAFASVGIIYLVFSLWNRTTTEAIINWNEVKAKISKKVTAEKTLEFLTNHYVYLTVSFIFFGIMAKRFFSVAYCAPDEHGFLPFVSIVCCVVIGVGILGSLFYGVTMECNLCFGKGLVISGIIYAILTVFFADTNSWLSYIPMGICIVLGIILLYWGDDIETLDN